jgi:signal transduction histidine kinase
VRPSRHEETALPAPPYEALRARLVAELDALGPGGTGCDAERLRAALDDWWQEQQAWNQRLAGVLGVHHEISNALVGIRGNAQLLMMSPAAQEPGVRERLEVVVRESKRIQEAIGGLRAVRAAFGASGPTSRAA